MSDRINIPQLRRHVEARRASGEVWAVLDSDVLALMEAIEASKAVTEQPWFVVRSEGTAKVLLDALARFDFGDEP